MFHRFRERFGAAGLIVAVVALVAAMAGGAYAASGALTGKQKKEVEKIAKKYAGQPGAAGSAGPAGPAGSKGDTGAQGPEGKQGSQGKEGSQGKQGIQGVPGTTGFTSTLPSGKTETGVYGFRFAVEGLEAVPVTFNIPLASAPGTSSIFYVTKEEVEEDTAPAACPGSVTTPEAKVVAPSTSPAVCVYENSLENVGEGNGYLAFIGYPKAFTTGVVLLFGGEAGGVVDGTYAVTAP